MNYLQQEIHFNGNIFGNNFCRCRFFAMFRKGNNFYDFVSLIFADNVFSKHCIGILLIRPFHINIENGRYISLYGHQSNAVMT